MQGLAASGFFAGNAGVRTAKMAPGTTFTKWTHRKLPRLRLLNLTFKIVSNLGVRWEVSSINPAPSQRVGA